MLNFNENSVVFPSLFIREKRHYKKIDLNKLDSAIDELQSDEIGVFYINDTYFQCYKCERVRHVTNRAVRDEWSDGENYRFIWKDKGIDKTFLSKEEYVAWVENELAKIEGIE